MSTFPPFARRAWSPCVTLLVCSSLSGWLSPAMADNDSALQAWSAASGQPAPELVSQDNGDTRLSWKQSVTADVYRSQRDGNPLLSGANDGLRSRLQLQSDLRNASADQGTDWFMLGLDVSNDTHVLQDNWNLSTFQLGRAASTYRVTLGDVPVDHSSLGARSDMRGLALESRVGSVQLSGAAGTQSETWRSLSERRWRRQALRDVYAVKLATALGDNVQAFATTQAFREDIGSVDEMWLLSPKQEATASTLGMEYATGPWAWQAEAGTSRWQVAGESPRHDQAHRIAAQWQGESASVQAGHHDVGAAYAALSADVVPGVRESHVQGSWRANETLALAAGYRRARNSLLANTQDLNPVWVPRRTNNLNASATVDVPDSGGLQLQLHHQHTTGDNHDATRLRNHSQGLQARYPLAGFNTSIGLQATRFENGATPLQDASAHQVSAGLGWSNALAEDSLWRWTLFSQFIWQRQRFDAGTLGLNRSLSLSADVQRDKWGAVSASAQWGRLRSSATGGVIGRSIQLDVSTHPGPLGSWKAYLRNNQNSATGVNASYRERVYGMQWQLAMD